MGYQPSGKIDPQNPLASSEALKNLAMISDSFAILQLFDVKIDPNGKTMFKYKEQ